MPAVLCYGDSNTWGYEASSGERLGRLERWTGMLQRRLGDEVYVVEEALNGRTTVFDLPGVPYRNGFATLPLALEAHAPLDVVVLALGTNDVWIPGVTARDAARGVGSLVDVVAASAAGPGLGAPRVLVLVPPPLAALTADWREESDRLVAESSRFAAAYADVLAERGTPLLDLGALVSTSAADGVHFEAEDHAVIGRAVAEAVRGLLAGVAP